MDSYKALMTLPEYLELYGTLQNTKLLVLINEFLLSSRCRTCKAIDKRIREIKLQNPVQDELELSNLIKLKHKIASTFDLHKAYYDAIGREASLRMYNRNPL